MKRAGLAAALAVSFLLAPAARAGDYAAYGFSVLPDGSLALSGYEVGPELNRNRLFEVFTAAEFGDAAMVTQGAVSTATGAWARLEIHENPHATLLLETAVPNALEWRLAPDVGAIVHGRWAEVGDDRTLGALVVLGSADLAKSGERVTAVLGAGERALFRASVGGDGLAAVLAEGGLAADVYLGEPSDVVRYTTATVDARLEGGVGTVRVTGAVRGQVLSVTFPRTAVDPARLAVDGTSRLQAQPSLEALQAAGTGYTVFADDAAVEIVVLDDFAATTLRIGPLGPSLEAILGVALAAGTFVAATLFAARRRQ